jgi:fumarate hydratase class II
MKHRIEKDALGELPVPAEALYGIQTQRAVANFPISGIGPHPKLVWATVLVKKAAAMVHKALGRLDAERANAIIQAADEVLAGRHADQFVVDAYQAGAGTSHNMNVNEVLANRANEILGAERGKYDPVHPNDHVNMAQSTNDVMPTAGRIAALVLVQGLVDEVGHLADASGTKAEQFADVAKAGRTHLNDAVPTTLGREFGAYAGTLRKCRAELEHSCDSLCELGIGGTAAGTGLNAHPEYRGRMVRVLSELSGLRLTGADDIAESMQNQDQFLKAMAAMRTLAVALTRIANDLRLLSSGPHTGLREIELPPVQPGSSAMPGKVNPSIVEMLNMVCYQVLGNDTCVAYACQAGQLELNVMMPLMIHNVLFSAEIMANAVRVFRERCVEGITANVERCRTYAESTAGLAMALNPYIGYARAAEIAKRAAAEGRSIYEVAKEEHILPDDVLESLLRP